MQASSSTQLIEIALQHHRAGRLAEAEAVYRQILQTDPNQLDAVHLLGVLAHQTGHNDAAAQLISQAIKLGAGAEAYNNLGTVFRAQNKLQDAMAAYRRAIELNANYREPHTNIGRLYHAHGRYDEAMAYHRRALELDPKFAEAHHNMAMTLDQQGKSDQAIAAWEKALDLEPDHLHALNNFGTALIRSGGIDRAIALLRRYTQLVPNDPEGWANLSTALLKADRSDEALAVARKVFEMSPQRAESYNNLGALYLKMGRLDDAIEHFKQAIQMNPDFAMAHGNLGSAYEQLNRQDLAVVEFETAARLLPNSNVVFNSLSSLYRNMNRDVDSLRAADRSLVINPNQADAHGNRAFALLSVGNLVEGFYEYEWRWRCSNFTTPPREFDRPMWDGSDPAGRAILVHTEQGYGDVIQMARYFPLLAARGAKVYVECFTPLKPLLEAVGGISRVIVPGLKLVDFDLHCPVMSLPRAFRTTMDTIPDKLPYITAPESRREPWRSRIEQAAGGLLKIGLTWGGNTKPDPRRSCDLKALAPLAQVPGVTFISLQTGPPAEQLKDAPPGMQIVHLGDDLKDFADTAAILENLDLMITIDTAVAHLAGAVGVKTWTMLTFSPDWRWLRDREDCPWYPTMRLFRQSTPRDWEPVIARVADQLKQFAQAR